MARAMTPERNKLWREIIKTEPRLARILARAKDVKDDGSAKSFCANRIWYEEFKPELIWLVGFESSHAALRTTKHYDVAYEKIYEALPACRGCICF